MATFNGSTSNVALNFLWAAFWGLETAVDIESTPMHSVTRYSEKLGNGFVADVHGTGLTYVADGSGTYELLSGIVTRVTLTDQSGANVYDFSGFSVTVESLNAATSWTGIMRSILKGNDSISGGNGDDVLYGYDGDDTLQGGAGADHLYGGAGADILKGGPGDDETFDDLFGGAGNDTLDGTGGFSIAAYSDATGAITGNFATGKVVGNASVGTDTLINISEIYGSMYADTLLGNDETNYFTGNGGNDFISGGLGIDGVIYDTKVSINLATGTASDGLGGTDTLKGIEDVYGSDFDDTITGDNGANLLDGAGGNDLLSGSGGNDDLSGGGGNDTLNGGAGADSMAGGLGDDIYYVDNAGDKVVETVAAAGGTDLVISSISHTLGANVENLRLTGTGAIIGTGNSLNNTFYAAVGASVDGAAGTDTVSYAYAPGLKTGATVTGLTLNLSVLNASGQASASGVWGTDKIKNIENVIGTAFDDVLTGNAVANTLNGGAGNDTLDGKAGADYLIGGDGNDLYYVDNAGDKVVETAAAAGGTDLVNASISHTLGANVENLRLTGTGAINGTGNSLNNLIYAGTGANVIDGAAGTDTLSYAYATGTTATGVTLNLSVLDASGQASASGISGADKIRNIENVIGSNYNDVLTGNAGANTLSGGSGNDTIKGGSGNDTLDGGTGKDLLDGGAGLDAFVFNTTLSAITNVDTINGFVAADDTIRLENSVFAKLAATGTLKASFFVANTSGKALAADDYIVYETDTGKVFYDADGSGAAAAVHFATLTGMPAITAADFVVT